MWNQLDGLTGLLNQNSFLNRSEEMNYTNGMLIVFDVDDFKHVNDVYGHVKGDLCLRIIADCIKKAYAKYGYCYRVGGDEFCVLWLSHVVDGGYCECQGFGRSKYVFE